jgi:ribosomal protein S18 acetylase RimI-like enzyme
MAKESNVRKLKQSDAESWTFLRAEALEAHPLAFSSILPKEPRDLLDSIRERLMADESTVLGAFVDDLIIGTVGIRRNSGKKERHKAYVWGMYVRPGHRRNGAGRNLLSSAIRQAHAWNGVEQIHLSVSEVAQEAKNLYESSGFVEWGREPRSICWGSRYADEIHMILDLHN